MNVSQPPQSYIVDSRSLTVGVRFLLLGAFILSAATTFAQEVLRPAGSRPLRVAYSDSRELQLRIDAGRGKEPCRAVLLKRGQREPLWEGELVNEISPEYAFIREDGAWVVTLNEFRKGGAEHAVVVYDAQGEPKATFELDELLEPGDRVHVKREGEALRWLDGARTAWLRNPDAFEIRLPWGAAVVIELEKGAAGRREAAPFEPQPSDRSDIDPADFIEADGDYGPDSFIDKMADMLLMLDAATAEALSDPNVAARIDAVRQDIEGSTPNVTVTFDADGNPEITVSWDANFESAEQRFEMEQRVAEQVREVIERMMSSDARVFPLIDGVFDFPTAGNSEALGVPVPLPNPENPVDYVAWFNDLRHLQSGVNAAEHINAAIASRLPLDLSNPDLDKLFAAAMAGDPDALNDPTIADWLASNQDALAAFSQAGKADHYSHDYQSADGSLIGVLLPDMAGVRDLARIAVVDAKHALSQGDTETAVNRAIDIMNNARLVGESGTLISTLVGVAMGSLSHNLVADIIKSDPGGTLDYAALANRLDQIEGASNQWFARAVQFERAMAMDAVQRIYQFDPDTGETRVDFEYLGTLATMSVDGDTNPLMTAMAVSRTAFEGTVSQMNEYYDRLGESLHGDYQSSYQNMLDVERAVAPGGELHHPILSMLAPSMTRAMQVSARGQSGQRASRLLAHLHAYRQANGSYPDSLDAFGERDFVYDPFSGEQFQYIRDGDTFRLFSVGPDGENRDGLPRPDRINHLNYWPK